MKKISAVLLGLFIGTTTFASSDIDKRKVLPLAEHQRNHILTEMRALLSGTRNILDALSREDMTAVASHARSLGMGMVHKGEDHLLAVLPKEFMQMGMAIHKDFDQIAADAESLKDPKHTLRQLSESMKKCSACHESYQIRVENLAGVAARETHSSHHHQ
ncbi:MAG TPA: hypothetical protein VHB01_11800 [Nitrosospira sp.]|nr:hypothetical protein [Nitrosospira sp.]